MIKINLLGVVRPVAKVAGPPPTVMRQALIFGVSVLVAFGIVGFMYRYWTSQIEDLNKKIAKEKIEADRLAGIRAENQRYIQQRQQLEMRINTIQKLQESRVGPADLLAALGNTVNRSNDLYLLAVSPEGGRIAIRGLANSVESIANFIANLKQTERFEDVQLRQYFQDDRQNQLSFRFNLDCVYKLPPTPSAGAPLAAPGTPVRRAAM